MAEKRFKTYGLDLSKQSLIVASQYLQERGLSAEFIHSDMRDLSYFANHSLDLVIDVFSSNCLDLDSHHLFINEVKRVLKPTGQYFVYTPSKASDAFLNCQPSILVDSCTLNGIYRPSSPFAGNHYSFRFEHPTEFADRLTSHGLFLNKMERISRTYSNMSEYFEFISAVFKPSPH